MYLYTVHTLLGPRPAGHTRPGYRPARHSSGDRAGPALKKSPSFPHPLSPTVRYPPHPLLLVPLLFRCCRSVAPRSVAPRSVTPRSVAPRSVAPRSVTPRSVAPRSVTAVPVPLLFRCLRLCSWSSPSPLRCVELTGVDSLRAKRRLRTLHTSLCSSLPVKLSSAWLLRVLVKRGGQSQTTHSVNHGTVDKERI